MSVRSRVWPVLLALLLPTTGRTHIIPVPPSTCAFDPIEITAPEPGVTALASPPGPADQLTILYDPQSSGAQFDASTLPPRDFSAAGITGSIAFPDFFSALLTNGADLTASVPVTFTLAATTAAVTMPFTTGLAVTGNVIVEGAPIGSDGRFTLVSTTADSGLGPPFGAGPLLMRLGCQAAPRPDTDQFMLATQTTLVSGLLTAQVLRLRVILAPGLQQTADFTARPAIVRAHAADTVIAAASIADGLPARSRRLFVGQSSDGRVAIGVRMLRRTPIAYLLALKVRQPVLPPSTARKLDVAFTYDVGGLLSRTGGSFRVNARGTRARFP